MKEGRSIFGLYPPSAETKAEYETWKKKRGNRKIGRLIIILSVHCPLSYN